MIAAVRSLLSLLLAVSAAAAQAVFWERDGLVVFEVESAQPSGSWELQREMSGYTGAGYYTWTGGSAFGAPGSGVLSYRIRITTPGIWQLRIRNRHDQADHTEHNDVFTRMDGGPWVKMFSSKRGEWTWHSRHEFSHSDKPPAQYELAAGEHLFEISGRSNGFSIDRVHLFLEGAAGAEDASQSESSAGPSMPELTALPKVARFWQGGALGRALKAAEEQVGTDGEAGIQSTAAAAALRDFASSQRERIATLKASAPAAAVAALAELAQLYTGHDLGKELLAEAKAWSKEPAVESAIAADQILAAMTAAKGRLDHHGDASDPAWLKRNQRQLKLIVAAWQQLEARYPDAPATVSANAMIDALGLRTLQ